jgi:multidrug efflux system membrane fusion protein
MTTRDQAFVLVLGAAAAGAACAGAHAEKAPARPVRVEHVQSQPPVTGLRYSAVIQPYEQVPLAFKAAGYVRDVRQVSGPDGRPRNLQQGDVVARGTVLAQVNPAEYAEKVNQAKAQLADMEAGLAKARADAARAQLLYDEKALTRPDYDGAMSSLASAQARVDGARAQLESAQIAMADTALVSPAGGVVLKRDVEVGTLAGVGAVGFVLADLSRVKAVFGVPDQVVQRVRVGAPLLVTSDAYAGAEFPGRVTAVSPSADDQSRVFYVEVTIPNADGRLKAGMIGTVEVASRELSEIPTGSATVSVAAVVKSSRPGAFAVFVVDGADGGATARARDVTLGRISGNRVAVDAGLKPGDRVIVSGASLLVDGDAVRVIPGSEGE